MPVSRPPALPRPAWHCPTAAAPRRWSWRAAALACGWAAVTANVCAALNGQADAAGAAAPGMVVAAPLNRNAGDTAGCGLLWQVKLQLGAGPRSLQVDMVFDAGPRTHTSLRLPGGWAGVSQTSDGLASVNSANGADTASPARLQAVADAPTLRTISHAAGERVHVQWRLTPPTDPAQGGSVQLAASWFALAGQGVLPVPDEIDERQPPTACVAFTGLSPSPDDVAPLRWASSHGLAEGPTALFRVAPGAANLRTRVQQALYAGGALQTQSRGTDGGSLMLARPSAVDWRFSLDALGQAAAQALAQQRQFWGDTSAAAPMLVLLLPLPLPPAGEGAAAGRGSAWHQALALQGPPDLALPGSAADALLTEALVRHWVPDRFGPVAHTGRGDEANRAWFSEGWAEFYTHRLLLRGGQWTPEDYAAALNRKIERFLDASQRAKSSPRSAASAGVAGPPGALAAAEMAGARGEWLALQWHSALRATGQPGLDSTMRRLLVAPALARHDGPISAPLATHRLVAALRPALGDIPLRDITRQAEQGEAPVFGPGALGPCFVGQRVPSATWRLGFDPVSLANRRVSGVEPGGPAEAAGLRDGMVLTGHLLVPGDPTQAVQLKVMDASPGTGPDTREIREIRYLPAGEPVRELPRYQPVANAMQQTACLGWLGLGPDAAAVAVGQRGMPVAAGAAAAGAAGPPTRHGGRSAGKSAGKTRGKSGAKATGKSAGKPAAKSGKSGKPGSAGAGQAGTKTAPASGGKPRKAVPLKARD